MNIIDVSVNTEHQASCLSSKGIQTIIRYYATNLEPKVLTLSEAKAISAAGMQIGIVFEDGNKLKDFTKQNGYNQAISAYKYATQTIKQPFGSAIYFAVDLDVTNDQIQSTILPYFNGIRAGLLAAHGNLPSFKIGAYGCGAAVNALKKEGLCDYRWLSASTSYNGSRAALQNGDYEFVQHFEQGFKMCNLSVDQDQLRLGVSDIGVFSL